MKHIILFSGEHALVDDDDFLNLSKYKWYNKNGYAVRYKRINGKLKCYRMHRDILKPKDSQCIDHIDRNPLNNTRSNLRLSTIQQNALNKAIKNRKFKGVYVRGGKYRATIKHNKKYFYLGTYSSDIAAAYAYNKKAKELSEFYFLNKLDDSIEDLEKMLINCAITKNK